MLLGFKRQFAPYVENGTKTHTIRALRKNPPRVGEICHCYVDPRQKTMRLLGRWECVKVESIRISASGDFRYPLDIRLEGQYLAIDEIERFLWRDGFRARGFDSHAHQAFVFWKKRLPFEGQVIHWKY